MIKANELRIGNSILFNGVETQLIASDFAMQCKTIGIRCEFPNFEPIRLTEKILLNSDFVKTSSNSFAIRGFKLYLNNGLFIYRNNYGDSILLHVHHLQNLYFALKNKELNLKIL